uniref:Rab-GAP TBC domain-containing protein n=1 Tax=Romanomermis culicivorax TaxID=13658 RepID=A0A915K2K3_ROMCU
MVKETISEVGHGYYECLYKKANTLNSQDAYDPAMKQIDLDLTRTLPHNKNFEDLNASKIESLRRVLYAYRWHNTDIGYCQGLNRLAAVALLYLNEEDAFWTLVAIVEYLQPKDYYGHTMLAAQADQRVLRDFVVDKMPKVSSHLKALEVDLSLFTFNWFLTIFVDSFVHSTYLNIWDSFLYEGNKVLFRFALAILKINENEIIACKSSSALHSCLSNLGENSINFEKLSQVAFKDMNPFPSKQIESKRAHHLIQLKVEIDNMNNQRER